MTLTPLMDGATTSALNATENCAWCHEDTAVGAVRFCVQMVVTDPTDSAIFVAFDVEITKQRLHNSW